MTTKVFDTFTGTNGVDLAAHTPDTDVVGGGWTDQAVNVIELDGAGAVKFATAFNGSWIDAGTADQWCISNWGSGGSDNRMSLYLRRNNLAFGSEDCYVFNFRQADTGAELKIYKKISGSTTELASGAFTNNASTTYSFEPKTDGANIDFIIDGVSELSITDSSITTGDYAGIHHEKRVDGNGRFYDFQIDDVAPGVPPTGINVFRRRMIMKKSA